MNETPDEGVSARRSLGDRREGSSPAPGEEPISARRRAFEDDGAAPSASAPVYADEQPFHREPGGAVPEPPRYRPESASHAAAPGFGGPGAGPKPLGRLAVLVTVCCWILLALTLLGLIAFRGAVINFLLLPAVAPVICTVLVALGIGWALLYLLTLRAARPGNLGVGRGLTVVVACLTLMVFTSGLLFAGAYSLNTAQKSFSEMFAKGTDVQPVNGRYNILLLGGDAGGDRTGRRPDSISVLSIDAKTGDTVSFGIPRNLQNAQFPDDSPLKQVFPNGYNCGDECIINTLYGEVNQNYKDLYPGSPDPGASAMMDAASGVLGIKVNSYFLIDMGGFSDMVDAVGGVSVNSGGWVPITSGEIPGSDPVRHYPPSEWMPPGRLKLDGYHAEWFARSREFTSDYNRIRRQQCVQSSMVASLSPLTLATHFGRIAKASNKLAESNIDRNQIGFFIDAGLRSRGHEQRKLTIGAPDFPQMFSTYPDYDQVHQRVQQVLDEGSKASGGHPSAVAPAAILPAPLANAQTVPQTVRVPMKDTAPDGTKITPEYLTELAKKQDDSTLGQITSDNGNCSPAT